MYETSFLRDGIVLGFCFAVIFIAGLVIGYKLAKDRFYRAGRIDGAANQRQRDAFSKPLRRYDHNAA